MYINQQCLQLTKENGACTSCLDLTPLRACGQCQLLIVLQSLLPAGAAQRGGYSLSRAPTARCECCESSPHGNMPCDGLCAVTAAAPYFCSFYTVLTLLVVHFSFV